MTVQWVRGAIALFAVLFSFSARAEKFCVQSFNAYGPAYSPNLEWRTELLGEQAFARELCPVFQLQEVWTESHFEQMHSVLRSQRPEATLVSYDKTRRDSIRTGLVSVVRGQVQQAFSQLFVANYDGLIDWVRRQLDVGKAFSVFTARFPDHPTLNTFTFYNTHLHHSSQMVRLMQILQLGSTLEQAESLATPVVLTGDFNFRPQSYEWALLVYIFGLNDSYFEVGLDPNACTYCSKNPLSWDSDNRRIDYIFYRSSWSQRLMAKRSKIAFTELSPIPLSDHFGVQTDFSVNDRSVEIPKLAHDSVARFQSKVTLLQQVREKLRDSGSAHVADFEAYINQLIQRFRHPQDSDHLIQMWLLRDKERWSSPLTMARSNSDSP